MYFSRRLYVSAKNFWIHSTEPLGWEISLSKRENDVGSFFYVRENNVDALLNTCVCYISNWTFLKKVQ